MTISIQQPVFLHQQGRRKNNEDSIYPFEGAATTEDRLFIVCDGVGGANRGEVASRMVCELFHAYFAEHESDTYDQAYFDDALTFVEAKLSEYVLHNPDCAGMATTITLLYIDEKNRRATIAWSGDSRVSHVRNGKILYETDDHSLVNELLKRGELTPEEAKVHPQRNVILRAISGFETPTQIDIHHITDIQEGDFFMLSTDGILESIDDRILVTLLGKPNVSLDKVRDDIHMFCKQGSNDNYSMYLVQIAEIDDAIPPLVELPDAGNSANVDDKSDSTLDQTNKKLLYLLVIAALAILLMIGVMKIFELREEKAYLKMIQDTKVLIEQENLKEALVIYKAAQAEFRDNKDLQKRIDNIREAIEEKELAIFRDSVLHEFNTALMDVDSATKVYLDSTVLQKIKKHYDTTALRLLLYQLDTLLTPQQDTTKIEAAASPETKKDKDTKPKPKDTPAEEGYKNEQ